MCCGSTNLALLLVPVAIGCQAHCIATHHGWAQCLHDTRRGGGTHDLLDPRFQRRTPKFVDVPINTARPVWMHSQLVHAVRIPFNTMNMWDCRNRTNNSFLGFQQIGYCTRDNTECQARSVYARKCRTQRRGANNLGTDAEGREGSRQRIRTSHAVRICYEASSIHQAFRGR